MKLIVISSDKYADVEPAIVTKMFEAGLSTFHIRKPKLSTKELKLYIEKIPVHFHNRLIIHSHHNLAHKFDLKGIHITRKHLERKLNLWWKLRLIRLRKPHLLKTGSCKGLAKAYQADTVEFDYSLIINVFNNLTGEFYSGFYEEGVRSAIKKSKKTLIASGGINEKTVKKAYELGFTGVALYGYLWKSDNPFNKYLDFLALCKSLNIPIE